MALSVGQRGAAIRSRDQGLTVKTEEFSNFLKEFKAKLGEQKEMQDIVDYEMGRVLNRTLALTGSADEEKIRKKWKGKRVLTLLGRKIGLVNKKTGRPQKFPDGLWANIESARATGLARTLAKVGASKATWAAIARKLGQEISVPKYVDNVMIPGGVDRFAVVTRTGDGLKYGVTVVNKFGVQNFTPPGGRQALFTAFAGRVNFYRTNMAKGVFDSASKIAAKYRGLFVKRS